MSISVKFSEDQKEMTIKVDGRFDFNLQSEFRNCYNDVSADTLFIIDLQKTTFMDSSAMGMLLLLREYSTSRQQGIRLVNCNPDVRRVLEISNLDKMFSME